MKYDCHVEVYDPARWQPASKDAGRTCATALELQSFLHARHRRHAVLVQPLAYCGTHGCLVDAVRTIGSNTRAVGTLSRYTDGSEIDALCNVGMRGTRVVMQSPNVFKAVDDIEYLHGILPAHWHIELTGSWSWLAGLGPPLVRLQRIFVAVCPDMWQHPFLAADTARFVWWLEMGNVYLKLLSTEPMRCQRDLCAAQPALDIALTDAADRLLWGSGWPHLSEMALPVALKPAWGSRSNWALKNFDFNAKAVYGFED
jgi:predicted TIM-barrel fold metal-dependent hydrolase